MSGAFVFEDAPAQPPAEATGQRLDWPRLYASLDARKFDVKSPPPPAVEVVKLGGVCIATQGNIQAVQAMAKAGKTALLGALIASAMNPEADCFGLEAENPRGLAVVHFDTEQSPQDHFRVVQKALTRAQQTEQPGWLKSYCLTDLAIDERRASIAAEMERAQQEHGGILFVILDGIADFIASPNDDKESFAFVAELHALAIRYSTCIFVVIHENPSSENNKTRGHLGSQLERKAETNLCLQKDADDVTTVFSTRSRNASIPKASGPRFKFSVAHGMHVSCATQRDEGFLTAQESGREDVEMLFGEFTGKGGTAFEEPPPGGITRGELLARIEALAGVKYDAAKKRLERYKKLGLIRQTEGKRWVSKL
jgi:hypothetical protein